MMRLVLIVCLLGAAVSATPAEGSPSAGAGCRIQFEGGASVNYGQIKRASLSATEAVLLAAQQRVLTVRCKQAVQVSVAASDGNSGTTHPDAGRRLDVPPEARFGLGVVAGKQLGAYALRLSSGSAAVDGVPSRLLVSQDGGATWHQMKSDIAMNGKVLLGWAHKGQARPAVGRLFLVKVQVNVAIAATSTLYLGREADLNGSLILSVVRP